MIDQHPFYLCTGKRCSKYYAINLKPIVLAPTSFKLKMKSGIEFGVIQHVVKISIR